MSNQNLYNIKISPEVIKNDIFTVTYSGGTATVYSSMTQILSGGTMGDSLLTDLSIPIFINQTILIVLLILVFQKACRFPLWKQ